jgi:hypothetical protein
MQESAILSVTFFKREESTTAQGNTLALRRKERYPEILTLGGKSTAPQSPCRTIAASERFNHSASTCIQLITYPIISGYPWPNIPKWAPPPHFSQNVHTNIVGIYVHEERRYNFWLVFVYFLCTLKHDLYRFKP